MFFHKVSVVVKAQAVCDFCGDVRRRHILDFFFCQNRREFQRDFRAARFPPFRSAGVSAVSNARNDSAVQKLYKFPDRRRDIARRTVNRNATFREKQNVRARVDILFDLFDACKIRRKLFLFNRAERPYERAVDLSINHIFRNDEIYGLWINACRKIQKVNGRRVVAHDKIRPFYAFQRGFIRPYPDDDFRKTDKHGHQRAVKKHIYCFFVVFPAYVCHFPYPTLCIII